MEINSIVQYIHNSIFTYTGLIILTFVLFLLIAAFEIKKYLRRDKYVRYRELLVSPFAPSISIVLPIFNEEHNVNDRVKALLSLQYNNFEIIVVNDGSSDRTLPTLKEYYKLEPVEQAVNPQLKTQSVQSYYRSKNPAYAKLTVIDKVHGGRADALNAGITSCEKNLCLCIETDCYLDLNSLLKLTKPFLNDSKRVIAASATVQVASSAEVKNGHLVDDRLPNSILAGFQAIEYFKAYLVERLSWGGLKGLHAISGGVQLFDTEILIKSGGYNVNIKKSGFELLVRMCKYMRNNDLEYKVAYIPDPLCWVKSPTKLTDLKKQRQYWSKGSRQTFFIHKDIFFNKKYGTLGMINLPFWFLSEWITPVVKLFILMALALTALYGNLEFAIILVIAYYAFAVVFSLLAFLYQERTYRQYSSAKDVIKIFFLVLLEPLFYHPLIVMWKVASTFSLKSIN